MSIDNRISQAKEFFESKGLAPDEIIRRGRQRGLNPPLIERAMVEVFEGYNPIVDKDRNLVWKVWFAAQNARGRIYKTIYLKRGQEIDALKRIIWLLVIYSVIATIGALKEVVQLCISLFQ